MNGVPSRITLRRFYFQNALMAVLLTMLFSEMALGFPASRSAQKPATKAEAVPSGGPRAGAGWQVVKDHAGKCQMSIPGDWKAVPGFGMASSAALHARAAVQADEESSWSELKQTAKEILKPSKIVEDSASRFSFVYATGNGKGFYTARPFTGYECIAQVDFDDAETAEKNSALATQMAGGVDKAH